MPERKPTIILPIVPLWALPIVHGLGATWRNQVVDSFDDLDLQEGLLRGIYSYGFEKPSAIQQRAIRPVLDGRDTIGQAQSGMGISIGADMGPIVFRKSLFLTKKSAG